MEVSDALVLRLLSGLRDCSRFVQRGIAEHPLDEIDVGLLTLAEGARGALRPSQAAAALEVAFPTITRHVQRLHRAGHVEVVADGRDGRGYRIVLTDAGAGMLGEFRADLIARFTPVLDGWDASEISALADGMHRLAGAMADVQAAPGRAAVGQWWKAHTAETGTGDRGRTGGAR